MSVERENQPQQILYECPELNLNSIEFKNLKESFCSALESHVDKNDLKSIVTYSKSLIRLECLLESIHDEESECKTGFDILIKFLQNLQSDYENQKYHKINKSSKSIQNYVSKIPRYNEILENIGFTLNDDNYYEYTKFNDGFSKNIEIISYSKEIFPKLIRNSTITNTLSVNYESESNLVQSSRNDAKIIANSIKKSYASRESSKSVGVHYLPPKPPLHTHIIIKFSENGQTKFLHANFRTDELIEEIVEVFKKSTNLKPEDFYLEFATNDLTKKDNLKLKIRDLKLYPKVIVYAGMRSDSNFRNVL